MFNLKLRAIPVDPFDADVYHCTDGTEDAPDKNWIYGWGATPYSKKIASFMRNDNDLIMVKANTIGISSGLTDRKNKVIYTDDIVKTVGYKPNIIGIVKFGDYGEDRTCYHKGLYIEWLNKEAFLRNDIRYWTSGGKVKVIGNIHDNPELIKGSETK